MSGEPKLDFDALSGEALADGYYGGDWDGVPIMQRALARAEYSELAEHPMIKKDGTPVTDDQNRPLTVERYIEKAHPTAIDSLVAFISMSEDDPEFVTLKEVVTERILSSVGIDRPEAGNS
jgi:hypothetical protein